MAKGKESSGNWKNWVIGILVVVVFIQSFFLFINKDVRFGPPGVQTDFPLPTGDILRCYTDEAIGGFGVIPYFTGRCELIKPDGTVISIDLNPIFLNPGDDNPQSYSAPLESPIDFSIVSSGDPNDLKVDVIINFVSGGVDKDGNPFDPQTVIFNSIVGGSQYTTLVYYDANGDVEEEVKIHSHLAYSFSDSKINSIITVQTEKHTFDDGWYYFSVYRPDRDPEVEYTYFNPKGELVSEDIFNSRFED